MGPLTSSPYYHKTKGMFTEVRLSHWLSVVANTILGYLHPVKRAYFVNVPEQHAASISRASTCKVEEANLPMRCQQHNPLPHGTSRERERGYTHTHAGGFEICTLARYGRHTHTHSPAHAHSWGWDMHTCQIWHNSRMHDDPLWLFLKTGFTVTDTNPKS